MATLKYWDGEKWSPVLNTNDIVSNLTTNDIITILGGEIDKDTSTGNSEAVIYLGGMTVEQITAAISKAISDSETTTNKNIEDAKKEILTGDSTSTMIDAYDTLVEVSNWIQDSDGNGANKIISGINEEISKNTAWRNTLSYTDTPISGNYVSSVSQSDGHILESTKEIIPVYSISGSTVDENNGYIYVTDGDGKKSSGIQAYKHPEGSGFYHIPEEGKTGQYLGYSGTAGKAEWKNFAVNTVSSDGLVSSGSGHINQVWKTDLSGIPTWRDMYYFGYCEQNASDKIKLIQKSETDSTTIFFTQTSLVQGLSIFVQMVEENTYNSDDTWITFGETNNLAQVTYRLINPYWEANSIVQLIYIGNNVWYTTGYSKINRLDSSLSINGNTTQGISIKGTLTQTDGIITDITLTPDGVGSAASKTALNESLEITSGSNENELVSSKQVVNYVKKYIENYTTDSDFQETVSEAASNYISNNPTAIQNAVNQIQAGTSDPTTETTDDFCMMYLQYTS